MALIIPTPDNDLFETNWSGRPSNTMGTNVVSGGTAHTLGASFTQIFASTSFNTEWVEIIIHGVQNSATDNRALVNIYIGSGGNEQVLIPNLLASGATIGTNSFVKMYRFPLRIPAGSRISAKSQALLTSDNVYVIMNLIGGSWQDSWVGSGVEAVGAVTASSRGTLVTPGTTSDGSWTSLGTTTNEFRYLWAQHGNGNDGDTTLSAGVTSFELGVSSTLIPGCQLFLSQQENAETCGLFFGNGRWRVIPAGTALQARTRFSGTSEAGNWILYGVY